MKNKEIKNIVFYTFNSNSEKITQVCIFYEDGTVLNTDVETGKEAYKELRKQKNLKGKIEDYKNKKYIYMVSGETFEKFFQFFATGNTKKRTEKNKVEHPERKEQKVNMEQKKQKQPKKEKVSIISKIKNKVKETSSNIWNKLANFIQENRVSKFLQKNKFTKKIIATASAAILALVIAITSFGGGIVKRIKSAVSPKAKSYTTAYAKGNDEDLDNIIMGEEVNINDQENTISTFSDLLLSTTNQVQANAMRKIGNFLSYFNESFANAYIEPDKNIKAALSWDEVMAMDLAYNNYTAKELRSILNGSEIDSTALKNAYKTALLQLMGAHVIETRENPVTTGNLINSEEGRAFWEKYHNMFLDCKEATGQDKLNKVNALYQEALKDFPVTEDIREVGIAHADERAMIEPYKFSVIPMLSAAEMMFQNLEVDYTLMDKVMDYFDDLGGCNYADEIFDKASVVSLSQATNSQNPTYDEFKTAKINDLIDRDSYVIDDEHRDLSQLNAFREQVNIHFEMENGQFTGKTYYTTQSYTETTKHDTTSTKTHTKTTKETTNDRSEAMKKTSKKDVEAAEEEVDREIENENKQAKAAGEKQAEQTREEQQHQADQNADKVQEEVKQDEQDMQDKIDEANQQIDQNNADHDSSNDKPVNEKDFGDHNVDFDDQHSDSNGNLNNSVEDVTTDSTGDQSNEDLPDPNQTGAEFDAEEMSTEEMIDAYIESLENEGEIQENPHQYKK